MSEFNGPCIGGAGLRVSRWLLGFGCACWGPSAALLQREQKVPGAWVRSGPFLAAVSREQKVPRELCFYKTSSRSSLLPVAR